MFVRFSLLNRLIHLGNLVVLGTVVFILTTASAVAQVDCVNPYLDCADIVESETDTVRLISTYGEPGDTVWLDVHFTVPNDSMSGFLTLIRYHDAYLTPVWLTPDPGHPEDTLWVAHELLGPLALLQDEHPESALFYSRVSESPFDSGAIVAAFLPQPPDTSVLLEFVNAPLFRLPFIVNTAKPHKASAGFWFHEVNEYVLIDSAMQEYFCVDCRRTNLAVDSGLVAHVSFPTLVESCCMGPMRGNIDMDPNDEITIADLIYMVTYMFQEGPEPPCMEEADIDGNGVGPDIADLIHLVNYMFQEGPPPAMCP